jgi:hypothetical protein
MIGSAFRIDIPDHGAWIISVVAPQPSLPVHLFTASADADGKTLSWSVDGNWIEITSATNIMTQSLNSTLWVHHDPRYQTGAVRLHTAEIVDWLFPKK